MSVSLLYVGSVPDLVGQGLAAEPVLSYNDRRRRIL